LITIRLNNVRFRAYHGLFEEERQKGNDFVVNIKLSFPAPPLPITEISQTIDYAEVYEIVKRIMQQPVDLLETLVQTMAFAIAEKFPILLEVFASVEKLNPPIDHFIGSTIVEYLYKKQ